VQPSGQSTSKGRALPGMPPSTLVLRSTMPRPCAPLKPQEGRVTYGVLVCAQLECEMLQSGQQQVVHTHKHPHAHTEVSSLSR
jgi:hypothetical protein